MDTIGEMPRKDFAGNLHVLVIRDAFTRFTLLYPIPDTTAKHTVKCLMHMFGIFGCPAQILSDNGSQFVNEIITEFTKHVQVQHLRTMAYSKEENGLVERANKEVNRYLRDLIYDLRVDATWSDYIPLIQRIMNSTVNESTGVTPAELIFGNSIDLDRGMFNPISNVNEQPIIVSNWTAKMLEAQIGRPHV
jgi:transposase InsO family protein